MVVRNGQSCKSLPRTSMPSATGAKQETLVASSTYMDLQAGWTAQVTAPLLTCNSLSFTLLPVTAAFQCCLSLLTVNAALQCCLSMLPFNAAFHCCTSSALVPSVLYHCSDPILSVFQEHDVASDK